MFKPSKYAGEAVLERWSKDVGLLTPVYLEEIVPMQKIDYLEKLCAICEQIRVNPIWYQKETQANKMKMLQIYQMAIMYAANTKQIYTDKLEQQLPTFKELSAKVKNLRQEILRRKKYTDQIKKVIKKQWVKIERRKTQKSELKLQKLKYFVQNQRNDEDDIESCSNVPTSPQLQIIYVPVPSYQNYMVPQNQNHSYSDSQNKVQQPFVNPNLQIQGSAHQQASIIPQQMSTKHQQVPTMHQQAPLVNQQAPSMYQQAPSVNQQALSVNQHTSIIPQQVSTMPQQVPGSAYQNIPLMTKQQIQKLLSKHAAEKIQQRPNALSTLPQPYTKAQTTPSSDILQNLDGLSDDGSESAQGNKQGNKIQSKNKPNKIPNPTDQISINIRDPKKTEGQGSVYAKALQKSYMGEYKYQSSYSNIFSVLQAAQNKGMRDSVESKQSNNSRQLLQAPKVHVTELPFRGSQVEYLSGSQIEGRTPNDYEDFYSPCRNPRDRKQSLKKPQSVSKYVQLHLGTFALLDDCAANQYSHSMSNSTFFGSLLELTVQIEKQRLQFPQLHHHKMLIVDDFDEIEIPMNSTIARPSRAKDSVIKRSRILSSSRQPSKQLVQNKQVKTKSDYMSEINIEMMESQLHQIQEKESEYKVNSQSVRMNQLMVRRESLKEKILKKINSQEPSNKKINHFSGSIIAKCIEDKTSQKSQQLQSHQIIQMFSQFIRQLQSSMKQDRGEKIIKKPADREPQLLRLNYIESKAEYQIPTDPTDYGNSQIFPQSTNGAQSRYLRPGNKAVNAYKNQIQRKSESNIDNSNSDVLKIATNVSTAKDMT